MYKNIKFSIIFALALCIAIIATSCSSSNSETKANKKTVTLITYDSFPQRDTSLNSAIEKFEKESGIQVKIANGGDSGSLLSKAILTSGNPEGDVIWGIDNTSISLAIDEDIFKPYKANGLDKIKSDLNDILKSNEATPVDFGDVCINYDIAYFEENRLDVPTSLRDLVNPEYRGLFVTQNPSTSSPGFAFLMASIAEFGEPEWKEYWKQLKENEVKVSDSWDDAYYGQFSGASGDGKYPLVVSYATSPVAEIVYSDPPVEKSPTENIDSTCFRQVEFAGILRGSKNIEESKKLMDFLISEDFQKEIPLNLFVYPARDNVALEDVFTQNSRTISKPYEIDPKLIDENRKEWIETWTDLVQP